MSTTATNSKSTIMPTLRYHDAPAAIDWLCKVFGFERHVVYPGPNGSIGHAELKLGGGMIMLGSCKDDEYGHGFKSPKEFGGKETRSSYIVVPDADAVYSRAKAEGGTIIREIQKTDYGSREFSVKDPEGHSWSVGTYDPWASQG
jgi:uncharacterized glyoxalase superfamily protein PhnB